MEGASLPVQDMMLKLSEVVEIANAYLGVKSSFVKDQSRSIALITADDKPYFSIQGIDLDVHYAIMAAQKSVRSKAILIGSEDYNDQHSLNAVDTLIEGARGMWWGLMRAKLHMHLLDTNSLETPGPLGVRKNENSEVLLVKAIDDNPLKRIMMGGF